MTKKLQKIVVFDFIIIKSTLYSQSALLTFGGGDWSRTSGLTGMNRML